MNTTSILRTATLPIAAAIALAAGAGTAQSQTIIDQAKALAGNVTPGDGRGFPVTISQPGSYVLTSNLIVPAGSAGVHITAPNVTLDLNGFSIEGPVSCTQSPSTLHVSCSQPVDVSYTVIGIRTEPQASYVTLRNGNVRGFAAYGLWLQSAHYAVSDMTFGSNASRGAVITANGSGFAGRVTRSTFTTNGGAGATVYGGLVEHSVFSGNHSHGIDIERVAVLHSVASYNGQYGIRGDSHNPGVGVIGQPSTVLGSTIVGNKAGAISGYLFSLGSNFDGAAPF